LNKLVDRARSFADAIQSEINGRQAVSPPVQMRLTDNSGANNSSNASHSQTPGEQGKMTGGAADSGANQAAPNQPPPMEAAAPPDDGLAAGNPDSPQGTDPADNPNGGTADSPLASGNGQGSAHGSGTEPSSLFGDASPQRLGSDSFKIAIDAEPSDEASGPGSPGYLPPKVHAAINPQQYPDEPLARASVPPADQMTIKRVFER
jgi:hypothetical protein